MSVGEAIQRWVNHNRRHFAKNTQTNYAAVIWRFKDFAPPYLRQLTREHIEEYIEVVLQKHTARTTNCHLMVIKSFCRWLSEQYDVQNLAAKIKRLPEIPPRQRVLTEEEYQTVLSICAEQEADVITFLANTGLRSSELLNLKWGNVAADNQSLCIVGKGRKERTIPLNKTCRAILNKYGRKPPSNTINFSKSYTNRNALYALCQRLACRAAIPRFGPHALRHFFATQLMRKGVPLIIISKILGHASIKTTEQIYIHFLRNDLIGTTDCLDKK